MNPRLISRQLMMITELEIRRSKPAVTLEPLDLVLALFDARGEEITILQVGACDGVNNDPIYHHVVKGFTRAILVEPNPFAFARLQKTYAGLPKVTLIQAAIGDHDGEAHLYRVENSNQMDSEALSFQVASFYPEHLERHGHKPHDIERISVPCRSLQSLVTELGLPRIDILQVDAEGFDAAVVRMALKMPVRPDCINFEHVHLRAVDRKPLFDLLKTNGYLLGYDASNILALQMPLLERLKKGKT